MVLLVETLLGFFLSHSIVSFVYNGIVACLDLRNQFDIVILSWNISTFVTVILLTNCQTMCLVCRFISLFLSSAVLDEVDVLFGDDEFEEVLQRLLKLAPVTSQYLFVTATLPVDIYNTLVELFPDCNVILGPGMHRTSSGLEEVGFI